MTTLAPPSVFEGTAWSPALVRRLVLVVSVLAGLLATIGGPNPTGSPTIDTALVAITVGAITWLGAGALRWDAVLVTLLAGLTSFSIVGTLVGVASAAIGFVLPVAADRRAVLNAVLVGIAMNIAARSELDWFLGASTLVAIGLGGYIAGIGFVRQTPHNRRVVTIAAGSVAAVAIVATVGLGVFGYLAADDLRAGNTQTEAGLDALRDGDLAAAKASFDAAAVAFEAADARLANPVVSAARFVPGLSQHHRTVSELSAEAAATARFLSGELDAVDLDQLSLTNGRIDVDQVRALQGPLLAIQLRIEALQQTVTELDSPWLVPPVADRIHELSDELADQRQRSDDALSLALAAPGMLGGDEPRTYFIGFTTPAEARGSGGFMGNWAEMTITNGQIEMTQFGRADDLNLAGDPTVRSFGAGDGGGLDEWLNRYGPFNISSGPGGTTGAEPWKNINMSPDIATTGRAIATLYPQSGGGELDGVFIVDVYTLARLLEFTGPITLADTGQVLTSETAADFLLNDQYDVTKLDARTDVLEEFSRTVVDTLLATTLPEPTTLIDRLGPMVDQGRFMAWMARPNEQAAIEQIGMGGTLAPIEDAGGIDPGALGASTDALAITFNNAVGNKIDYYLSAEAEYRVEADAATGTTTGQLTLSMTNSAPVDGEPGYVIGNLIGLPPGTNRTWVSVYSRLPLAAVSVDGLPIDHETNPEAGYLVTSAYVTLPAGATSTLTFDFAGTLDVADGYVVTTRTPPTVAPTPLTVAATWTDPDGKAHSARERRVDPGTSVVTAPAAP